MNIISFVGLLFFAAILNEVKSARRRARPPSPSSPGSACSTTGTAPAPKRGRASAEVDLFDVMDLNRDGVATRDDYERCLKGTVLDRYTEEEKLQILRVIDNGGQKAKFGALTFLEKIDVNKFNGCQDTVSYQHIMSDLNVSEGQAYRILGNRPSNTPEVAAKNIKTMQLE